MFCIVMLLIGLGSGIQPLLGYCFGAKNKKRYMDVLKFSLCLAFGLSRYKSPWRLIERIRAGMAAPVDWIALINTNKIPIIGPE